MKLTTLLTKYFDINNIKVSDNKLMRFHKFLYSENPQHAIEIYCFVGLTLPCFNWIGENYSKFVTTQRQQKIKYLLGKKVIFFK